MLVSVAEFSNIISVLAVFMCFCGMFLLIMRNMTLFWLHGEELMFGTSVHTVQQRIPQMKMMKVHIPFTFKLQYASKSSYAEVQFLFSSQVPYTLQAFWGVSIRELHLFLWRPWNKFNASLQQGVMLQGHYQQRSRVIHEQNKHAEKTLRLCLPKPDLELGPPPRLCYPLVIFLVRRDNPTSLHPDETVALVSVVHIKDDDCTLPTSILAQYLKQANGQLSSLKQLYLATGNVSNYEEVVNESAFSVCEQLCVVCQFFPLSRALLPCRHTCVCASCFVKLDTCPMCRAPIKSYFTVRSEEYLTDSSEKTISSHPERLTQWLQDRLTDFIGFHR